MELSPSFHVRRPTSHRYAHGTRTARSKTHPMALSVASGAWSLARVADRRATASPARPPLGTRVNKKIIIFRDGANNNNLPRSGRATRAIPRASSSRDHDGCAADDEAPAFSNAKRKITAALLSASVLVATAPDASALSFPIATESLFPTEASPVLMNIPDGVPTKLDAEETGFSATPPRPSRSSPTSSSSSRGTRSTRRRCPSAPGPGSCGTIRGTW